MAIRERLIVGQVALLGTLILSGCAPTFTSEFRKAVVNGQITMIKSYLLTHPDWVNARDEKGRTPLHEAVEPRRSIQYIEPSKEEVDGEVKSVIVARPQLESARVLIEKRANVNAKDKWGRTPLHEAADYGRIALAEFLVKNGANVNARDRDRCTPLYYAMRKADEHTTDRDEDLARLLIESGANINRACKAGSARLLYLAASKGWMDVVEMLIKEGANVNPKRLPKGFPADKTPLGGACMGGFREIAELLIAEGANVNVRDSYGMTILHYLVFRSGTAPTAQVLIGHGAKVDAAAKTVPGVSVLTEGYMLGNGTTPLHVAAAYGRRDLVEVLIAKGADVNAKTEYGNAPLHLAVWTGHLDVVQLLIRSGADANGKTDAAYLLPVSPDTAKGAGGTGTTALHLAATKGYANIVKLLIAEGADVKSKNRDGTPLDIAVRLKQKEVADLLRKHGAVE
ncbi:MAG: ankyrin repeat domain-containing protein [Phycisphaerales bacterium]|nr:MAG: ankyrin repeat domain-containing protein [Phycisphaerales bacterium]